MTFSLTPDQVVALPIDELALAVLLDARDTDQWNWRNWMQHARQRTYQGHPDVIHALEEAWAWLRQHGLTVQTIDQGSCDAIRVSRRGDELLARGISWLRATERLNVELTPVLELKVRPQFLRGDFETAVFIAMKEVEIEVRRRAGFSDSTIGTGLMSQAFRENGPLWRADRDGGESKAIADLFRGAIGLFKNPSSHREVDVTDATEAAEMVLCADLLLRLLAKIPPTETSEASA